MPTENVNKADNLIDVGEADQQSTEINLDNKGEPEKVEAPKEEKIEIEIAEEPAIVEDKIKEFDLSIVDRKISIKTSNISKEFL